MKKIFYLLSLTFLMLQSCSSGDDNSSNNGGLTQDSQKILGKWAYFQGNSFPPGTTITGNESLIDYQPGCSTKKDYFEFWKEGTVKKVSYKNDCYEEVYHGTWKITDFLLTINFGAESYEIISLTDTILKIRIDVYSFKNTPQEKFEQILVLSLRKI